MQITLQFKAALPPRAPKLILEKGGIINLNPVSTCWKFNIHPMLYNLLNFDEHAWFTTTTTSSKPINKIPDAIRVKSDTLVHDNQSGEFNELVLISIIGGSSRWFHPHVIKYVLLAINYITNIKLYITDTNGAPVILNNCQFIITLHFLK